MVGAVIGTRTQPGRSALVNPETGSPAYIAADPGFVPGTAERGRQDRRFTKQGANLIAREIATGSDNRLRPPLPGLPFKAGLAEQHGNRPLDKSVGKQLALASRSNVGLLNHIEAIFDGDAATLRDVLLSGPGDTPASRDEAVVVAHAIAVCCITMPGTKPSVDDALNVLSQLHHIGERFNTLMEEGGGTLFEANAEGARALRAAMLLVPSGTGMDALNRFAGTHLEPPGTPAGIWQRKALEVYLETEINLRSSATQPGPNQALTRSARNVAMRCATSGGLQRPLGPAINERSSLPHENQEVRRAATNNWAWRQGFRTAGPGTDLEKTREVLDKATGLWVERFNSEVAGRASKPGVVLQSVKDILLPPRGTPFAAASLGAQFSHLQETPDFRAVYDTAFTGHG